MKTSLLFAVLVLGAASFLSSCSKDGQSITGPQNTLPLKSSTPPANPAIAYVNAGIGVMDTTGANATTIVTGSSGTTYSSPSWNYNGSMIAYSTFATSAWGIYTVDVSVNSKGVPVGSNNTKIYSLTTSDSIRLQSGAAASATSSTGLVAFTRLHTDQANYGVTDLCTISQSGGTPTVLASFKKLRGTVCLGLYEYPTWNSDDSKIAVARQDTNNHNTIVIFNSSTGAAEDSIPVSGAISHLEWSRSGMNELEYSFFTGSGYDIYYVAPSTGSTPTTNSVVCGNTGTWSPNNSSIMFTPPEAASEKLIPFTTTTSAVGSSGFSGLNWKR